MHALHCADMRAWITLPEKDAQCVRYRTVNVQPLWSPRQSTLEGSGFGGLFRHPRTRWPSTHLEQRLEQVLCSDLRKSRDNPTPCSNLRWPEHQWPLLDNAQEKARDVMRWCCWRATDDAPAGPLCSVPVVQASCGFLLFDFQVPIRLKPFSRCRRCRRGRVASEGLHPFCFSPKPPTRICKGRRPSCWFAVFALFTLCSMLSLFLCPSSHLSPTYIPPRD